MRGPLASAWYSKPNDPFAVGHFKLKSRRRVLHSSKRFQQQVMDVIKKKMIWKDENVFRAGWYADECAWFDVILGNGINDYTNILEQAWNNAEGYIVPDAGTGPTFNAINLQAWFQTHIEKFNVKAFLTNVSTGLVHLSVFECAPRFNHNYTPAGSILSYGEVGNLPETGTTAMDYRDIRFTPYMCPFLTHRYKFGAVKHYKIPAGGEIQLDLNLNDYKVTASFHAETGTGFNTVWPGKTKMFLCKVWGGEGSAVADSLARTTEGALRYRVRKEVHFSPVRDERPIVYDPTTHVTPHTSSTIINVQEDTTATLNAI